MTSYTLSAILAHDDHLAPRINCNHECKLQELLEVNMDDRWRNQGDGSGQWGQLPLQNIRRGGIAPMIAHSYDSDKASPLY